LEPELNVAMILRNGETLEWWTDFEKTARSFEQFSPRDARALRRWRDEFEPILEKVLIPESQSPPIPAGRRKALLRQSPEGRRLLEVSRMSPLEFVEREFENPAVQGALLFFNGLREVDLRCEGFGHHIPALLASKAKAQMSRGGAAALARALVSAVEEAGGEVRLETTPEKILVERGRVTGIRTSEGEEIRARSFVASGLNPQQTFLDLLDESVLPAEWRRRAEAFQYNLLAPLFALNLALSEPPHYRAAEGRPYLEQAFMVILGLEGIGNFPEIVRHHEAGTIPPTVMWGATPTVFDPSQAPAGKHTAFMWEKLPYRLGGDPSNWDREKESHGRHMLDFWAQYAPNVKDATEDWFVRSALDTERTFPNMREGDLLVGAFSNGQVGHDRPFPGAGHYRGYLEGLYLCGSCCHPGGNITGLPGYNCAQVLLADQGISADWMPAPVEQRLSNL
jgi:phytoene dehydrogenase-like protein